MTNKYYVYVHETLSGNVFYVGKGSGDRAWRKGRDLNWGLYVDKYLNNQYNIRIVLDNLSETQALDEEEKLLSKYGDQLVNRQNMNRSLNIKALNIRNEIEAKLRKVELDAELANDINEKANLFLEALKNHKLFANTIIENGLLAELLALRPLGNVQLLERTVRALVAANRKEQAQIIFDQYLKDYPHEKELTKVAIINKVIDKGTVKLTEQEDFVPPDPLPKGWQYAKERNEQVLRLDHKMYGQTKLDSYDLNVLKSLIEQDLSIAMEYVKNWIVQDERVKRKDPLDNALWLYSEARKIANKQKNLLEECLFQQRFTNLLKGRNKHYEKNLIILRKLAAKLSKQNMVKK
ncbi:cytoplasmic protein [Acinetobacter baumannii]|uniref:cytoplasmic protein n=1 Tax=Acinetobacter baumannii TaxID=470 RepID=UPI0038B4A57D